MSIRIILSRALAIAALYWFAPAARAADYPAPQQADWVAPDFRFHTGEVVHDLRLHYTTVGARSGEPVLIIHGTAGSGTGMLNSGICRTTVRAWTTARRAKVLHHPAGRAGRR